MGRDGVAVLVERLDGSRGDHDGIRRVVDQDTAKALGPYRLAQEMGSPLGLLIAAFLFAAKLQESGG